jgi:hypothetical protein
MIAMGKIILPSNIKSRNYNGKQNKQRFSVIYIGGRKVTTF